MDGGPSEVGIESTVVDLTVSPPRVLRPGMIGAEALRAALGDGGAERTASASNHPDQVIARSPGLLPQHYAPRARLVVASWRDAAELAALAAACQMSPEKTCVLARNPALLPSGCLRAAILPPEAADYARALYMELHLCDQAGAELILVEAPPPDPDWSGIADRLARAACARDGKFH